MNAVASRVVLRRGRWRSPASAGRRSDHPRIADAGQPRCCHGDTGFLCGRAKRGNSTTVHVLFRLSQMKSSKLCSRPPCSKDPVVIGVCRRQHAFLAPRTPSRKSSSSRSRGIRTRVAPRPKDGQKSSLNRRPPYSYCPSSDGSAEPTQRISQRTRTSPTTRPPTIAMPPLRRSTALPRMYMR